MAWTKIVATPDPTHGVPMARSSHGVSVLVRTDTLIVFGGEHLARTPMAAASACWACTGISSSQPAWQWIDGSSSSGSSTSPPNRIAHSQAVYADRYVYIFGGRAGITMEEKAMNDLWVLDTADYTWSEVQIDATKSDPPPEPRSFHRMICIGANLYVFGGCGAEHGRLNDLHKFDILQRTWHSLGASTKLRGRGGPNLLALQSGQKIAVVAGFAGEETSDGQVFDVAIAKWEDDEDLTTKLSGMRPRSVCVSASFPTQGIAIVFGGEVDPSDRGHEGAGGFENDIVVLDETTGALLTTIKAPENAGKQWPEQRGWSDASAFVDDSDTGHLFVFGGLAGDDTNPRRLDDLWRLTIGN